MKREINGSGKEPQFTYEDVNAVSGFDAAGLRDENIGANRAVIYERPSQIEAPINQADLDRMGINGLIAYLKHSLKPRLDMANTKLVPQLGKPGLSEKRQALDRRHKTIEAAITQINIFLETLGTGAFKSEGDTRKLLELIQQAEQAIDLDKKFGGQDSGSDEEVAKAAAA